MCPPCKIILDGGKVLPASLRLFARRAARGNKPELSYAALYYADIAQGVAESIGFAIAHQDVTSMAHSGSFDAAVERAHAWSELCCHRAKALRADAKASKLRASQLYEWAEYDRLTATELFGGEYNGEAWEIVELDGLSEKSNA